MRKVVMYRAREGSSEEGRHVQRQGMPKVSKRSHLAEFKAFFLGHAVVIDCTIILGHPVIDCTIIL